MKVKGKEMSIWNNNNNKMYGVYAKYMKGEIKSFPTECPICCRQEVHIFFYKWNVDDNKSSGWIWCSFCKNFEHGRFLNLNNGENLSEIDSQKLVYEPDYLERNKKIIDKYNNLKIG
ncbi:MAG: hypothetical protein ACK5LM_04115 [Lactovum sp.]